MALPNPTEDIEDSLLSQQQQSIPLYEANPEERKFDANREELVKVLNQITPLKSKFK